MFPLRTVSSAQRIRAAAPPVAVTLPPRLRTGRRLIGVFGGSFDPPTRSHLQRIRELVTSFRQNVIGVDGKPTQARLDELWVVPVFQHANPAKRTGMTPFPDRVKMLELGLGEHLGPATSSKAGLRISTIESEIGGISRTNTMLAMLQARHPDCDFVVYLGADLRRDVATWHGSDALRNLAYVQFLSRAGYDSTDTVGLPIPEMSSTDFRVALGRHDLAAAARLTEPRVMAFIEARPEILSRYAKRGRA